MNWPLIKTVFRFALWSPHLECACWNQAPVIRADNRWCKTLSIKIANGVFRTSAAGLPTHWIYAAIAPAAVWRALTLALLIAFVWRGTIATRRLTNRLNTTLTVATLGHALTYTYQIAFLMRLTVTTGLSATNRVKAALAAGAIWHTLT